MTTFYTLGARLSGMAAVVCAVLAVLAYPGPVQADDYTECYKACYDAGLGGTDLTSCTGQCMQQGGLTKCKDASCDNMNGGCVPACLNKMCNEGGKNPATARCQASTYGCRCN